MAEVTELRKYAKEITRECERRHFTFGETELLAAILKDEIRQCKERRNEHFKALAE